MPATVRFERSGACAEKHGGMGGAYNDVTLDTNDGPWVQFTYESLRTQDGAVIAAIAECGCWRVEGDDGFYSDVIVTLDPEATGADTDPTPIADRLWAGTDNEPSGQQPAFHAAVHLLVPSRDPHGNPVRTIGDAMDYIAETLRDQFLDWCYVRAIPETGALRTPVEVTVCNPYIEATFIEAVYGEGTP